MRNITSMVALCAISFGTAITAKAQQIPVLNQYIYNPMIYNAARTGIESEGRINIGYRRQWANMPFSPTTGTATIDFPLKKTNIGLGMILHTDKTHLTNNIGAAIAYAYHIRLSEDSRLSIGMTAGASSQNFDFNQSVLHDPNDMNTLRNSASSANLDLSAGLNYRWRSLDIGFSIPQLIQNNAIYKTNMTNDIRYQFSRHYLANVSYQFGNTERISYKPIVMMRYVEGLPVQFDATLLANWQQKVWAGVGYRSANTFQNTAGLNFTAGFALRQQLSFAYSVETLLDQKDQSSFGLTHEVLVSYKFPSTSAKLEQMEAQQRAERDENERQRQALNYRVDSLGKVVGATERKANAGNNNWETPVQALDQKNKALQQQNEEMEAELKKVREEISKISAGLAKKDEDKFVINYAKLGSVYFDKNSNEIDKVAKAQLDALIITLKIKKEGTVYLGGYASEEGGAEYNLQLSERRTSQIAQYLKKQGVNMLVVPLPFGEVAQDLNASEEERRQNRRVDLFLSKD